MRSPLSSSVGILLAAFLLLLAPGMVRSAETVLGATNAQRCYEYALAGTSSRMAIDVCTDAIADETLDQDDLAATYCNRGLLHMRSKRPDRALADFDRALRITAADRQRLEARLARLQRRLGAAVRQLPVAPARLRLSARRPAAYLVWRCGRAAAGPACRAAAAAEPERVRCLARDAMSDGERALLGWPLNCESE